MPKSRIMVLTEQTEKICLLSGNQTKSQAYYRKGEFGLRNWGFNSFVCKRTSENTNPLQLSVWQLKWESFWSLAHNNRRWKGLATDLRGGDLKKKKNFSKWKVCSSYSSVFQISKEEKGAWHSLSILKCTQVSSLIFNFLFFRPVGHTECAWCGRIRHSQNNWCHRSAEQFFAICFHLLCPSFE